MVEFTPMECADCLQSMTQVKSELLIRIACANCLQAREDLAGKSALQHKRSSHSRFAFRCPECGKWCWSRNAVIVHRQSHVS